MITRLKIETDTTGDKLDKLRKELARWATEIIVSDDTGVIVHVYDDDDAEGLITRKLDAAGIAVYIEPTEDTDTFDAGERRKEVSTEAFQDVFDTMRSYAGLPDINLSYLPYECAFKVTVRYADNNTYEFVHENANVALRKVSQMIRDRPPY